MNQLCTGDAEMNDETWEGAFSVAAVIAAYGLRHAFPDMTLFVFMGGLLLAWLAAWSGDRCLCRWKEKKAHEKRQ